MTERYDIVIIGTGAGGGTLAAKLAPTGLRILLLERGGFVPREKENWSARAVFIENRYHTREKWQDQHGAEFHPGTNYYVGGNTKFYGAALLRMREQDFGPVQHVDGISPAWPVSYAELAPYYSAAERMYYVHGERGADPTEPPADGPFPYPAVSHEPRMAELVEGFRTLGLKPFPLPIGIILDEADRASSPCIRCDTCDGFPCLVNAKADAHTCGVLPALRFPNVTLRTNARVLKLETNASGRSVTSVRIEQGDRVESVTADLIVVAAGAVNSAALLLRSANDRHPTGLANASDQVGRNYMHHNNSAIIAVSTRPNPTKFEKTIGLSDWYFGSKDYQFPMGAVQNIGKAMKEMLEGDAPFLTPGKALDYMARHSTDWFVTTEDLPLASNRVEVTPSGQVKLSYRATNEAAHKQLLKHFEHALSQVGHLEHFLPSEVYLAKKLPIAGVAHQCGTLKFGDDPQTSVLDRNCKAHDLDNLYVVDASFFPSSSSVNPSLTIIANALRVGDHLIDRLGVPSHDARMLVSAGS
ncbi:MAG: GMC family oxidoreductase [Chloroflexota bacterium]